MKLSNEQKDKAVNKLKEFTNTSICNMCGSRNWIVNDTFFEMREFNGGGFKVGGNVAIFPVIAITCERCSNTYFFNAIRLGLINKNE